MTNATSKFRAWDVLGGIFCIASLLFVVMGLSLPISAVAAIVGGPHDFVDNGFTGGGACAACHIPHNAGDGRLWPRVVPDAGWTNPPARLCMDCHDGSMPTDAGWPAATALPTPPAVPHEPSAGCIPQFENCTACHLHDREFRVRGDAICDCLSCHDDPALDACGVPNIDAKFYGIGSTNGTNLLSQHSIKYENIGTGLCYKENNECWKCHPADRGWDDRCYGPTDPDPDAVHPKADAWPFFLYYADNIDSTVGPGAKAECDGIPKALDLNDDGAETADGSKYNDDMSLYQDFCLACHDGVKANTTCPHSGDESDTEFHGAIEAASDQVPPTDRSDPSSTQSGPPWSTPPVPAKDPNLSTTYFAYYEVNGHGSDERVLWNYTNDSTQQDPPGNAQPMNRTCLGWETKNGVPADRKWNYMGCHTVHGSTNRFLLDDTILKDDMGGDPRGNPVKAIKKVRELGGKFCYDICHSAEKLGIMGAVPGENNVSAFHSWKDDGDSDPEVLHDTSPGSTEGWATWSYIGDETNVSKKQPDFHISSDNPLTAIAGVLPFYNSADSELHQRKYPTDLDGSPDKVFFCVTCHDPHGTLPFKDDTVLYGGMPRMVKFDMKYDDPLCRQCHSE